MIPIRKVELLNNNVKTTLQGSYPRFPKNLAGHKVSLKLCTYKALKSMGSEN